VDGASMISNEKKQGKGKTGQGQRKKQSNWKSLLFMSIMILAYVILYFVQKEKTVAAIQYTLAIFKELLPILIFVYLFMFGFAFINEKKMKQLIERAPHWVQYLLMSVLGTLSHGPIYAWYPFLKELHKKGLSLGSMGSFLYARGIKLTLIPMLIAYFDVTFAVLLIIFTFLFAIIEGLLLDLTAKKS
jgi:uncharacterized membrane protein YraQ (UPF0718 family)